MAIDIIPKNSEAGVLGMPNGFWSAFCVETPVSEVTKSHYKPNTNNMIIVYHHDGYVGEWFSKEDALKMYEILIEYVKTDEYFNHRYFKDRTNQMDYMLEFLPKCDGFKMQH